MIIFLAAAGALFVVVSLLILKLWSWNKQSSKKVGTEDNPEWQVLLAKRDEIEADATLSTELKDDLRAEWALGADAVLARSAESSANAATVASGRKHAWAILAAILAVATLIYGMTGRWDKDALGWQWNGLSGPNAGFQPPPKAGAAHPGSDETLDERVARLERKLQQTPDDVDGWVLLARSRGIQRDFPKAADALERALVLVPGHPDLLSDLADMLAMTANKSLAGRPAALVEQALQADPQHRKALSLAATGALQQNNLAAATGYWKRLRATFPENSPDTAQVDAILARIDSMAGTGNRAATPPTPRSAPVVKQPAPAPAQATPASQANKSKAIEGRVRLSPELIARVKKQALPQSAVLFVVARLPGGPPMPVAALRLSAEQLAQGGDVAFRLDDSRSMMPTQKLSALQQVDIEARISLGGTAGKQRGDLIGTAAGVKVGTADVRIQLSLVHE